MILDLKCEVPSSNVHSFLIKGVSLGLDKALCIYLHCKNGICEQQYNFYVLLIAHFRSSSVFLVQYTDNHIVFNGKTNRNGSLVRRDENRM